MKFEISQSIPETIIKLLNSFMMNEYNNLKTSFDCKNKILEHFMVSDQLSEKILTDKLQQREKTSLAELI